MSVLQCTRPGCDNVMCNTMIDGHWICEGCLVEFCEWKQGLPKSMRKRDLEARIDKFLSSKPTGEMVDTEAAIESMIRRAE